MTPAPDTGRTAEENEMREALATELASIIYGGGMISPLAFATRLLSGPLAPILQEAAHLRAENANLRDRVREAEKGAEAMRWRRTGSRMNLLENARPEVQWFRPSDGLVQMFPDGFDPNSGTYGPVVIVGGHPIFLCPGETLLPATEPQEAGE